MNYLLISFICFLGSAPYDNIPHPQLIETSAMTIKTPPSWKPLKLNHQPVSSNEEYLEAKSELGDASLKLFIHPLDKGFNLEGLDSSQSLEDFSSVWKGYQLIDSGETELDSQEAVWHIIELSSESPTRMLQYVVEFQDRIYELSFSAPKDKFNEWIPLFQEVAKSLKFKKSHP